MAHEASPSNSLEFQIQQALVDALLDSEAVTVRWNQPDNADTVEVEVAEIPDNTISYPWNPAAPESESFFNTLEQKFSIDAISDDEMGDRADAFFSHLDSLFAAPTLETLISAEVCYCAAIGLKRDRASRTKIGKFFSNFGGSTRSMCARSTAAVGRRGFTSVGTSVSLLNARRRATREVYRLGETVGNGTGSVDVSDRSLCAKRSARLMSCQNSEF